MAAKEHYNKHLANFYSWMIGDFDAKVTDFITFCIKNRVTPQNSKSVIDLGAGNGIQTVALAKLGFHVTAIDFNKQLLDELQSNAKSLTTSASAIYDDIRNLKNYAHIQPELIVCCGDTLTHLESLNEVRQLITDASKIVNTNGKIIFSFRDYSDELHDTQRFIPVKSDSTRILTCMLEYFPDKIRVTDLLHELENGQWVQKISSYYKIRLSKKSITQILEDVGFKLLYEQIERGVVNLIAEKIR